MSEYPKQDTKIILYISDNSRISGSVKVSGSINITGRSIFTYLQDSDPDIVLYNTSTEDGTAQKTLLLSKGYVVWVYPLEGMGGDRQDAENFKKVKFKLSNTQEITGEVPITGFKRVSDYFMAYSRRFYVIYDCSVADKKYDILFLASAHVLWKEPVD